MAALQSVGLDEAGAIAFCDAAMVVGAMSQGRRASQVQLGFVGASAEAAEQRGGRPRADAVPGSMEAHLHEADRSLAAIEAIAACSMRLDAALVVATSAQTTAVGSALLAERDITDPGELSATARERWRARAKRRTREEIVPAIGWTPGETVHLVGLATAPVAFSMPVVVAMSRGLLPWRLGKALWRACEGLDAADAAHVATVMCGDDPESCVPERLAPDGTVRADPWEHRAFYLALAREVAKVTGADDTDPAEAEAARAARQAAYDARDVYVRVDEDGTGSLTLITSAFWAATIKDRLDRGARSARLAGDARTLKQLQADIARTLLANTTVGFADLPTPTAADATAQPTTEDLIQAGWTPELIQALSGLPPAVLQVIVPLMGLHDPATAHTLPAAGRAATRPDPNTAADQSASQGHTGRAGCPSCTPTARTAGTEPTTTEPGANRQGDCDHGGGYGEREECVPGEREECVPAEGEECVPDQPGEATQTAPGQPDEWAEHLTEECARARPDGSAARGRRLWVGELLGAFGMFVSPTEVRQLALSPGTTMARLLVDPADGRCVERSIATYRLDAAMRAQLLAADVTCRAPGCHHPGATCQVDHVIEHGTPGGVTSERNGQLLHTGHHEPKTAKAWDAELAANRDITWTSLLGRIYRTRAWDYRRYVTLLVDAIDAVRSAPPVDQPDELNRQVYLALTHRDLDERLNAGDDDLEPDIVRFEGWPLISLTHRDRQTGARVPGPSADAVTQALTTRATHTSPPTGSAQDVDGNAREAGTEDATKDGAGPPTDAARPRRRPILDYATRDRATWLHDADGDEPQGVRAEDGESKAVHAEGDGPIAGQKGRREKTGRRPWGRQGPTERPPGQDKACRAAWRLMKDEDIPPF